MTAHAVQTSTKAGVVPTFVQVTASDKFANSGREVIHVKNDHATLPTTVTFSSQAVCNQGSTHNMTVTIAAMTEKMIGPFEPERFNDADGNVDVAFTAQTDVTAAVFKR